MAMGEFELIGRLIRPLARGCPAALDLTDDAALLDVPDGQQLVLAKDAMVEGVHFLADDPPELIAGKILRVNLSDLAAMAADPLGYLMVLARPRKVDDAWLEAFYRGLARDQQRFGLHLMGGDTVSTPGPLMLSLTILGLVPRGRALLRSGAGAGDDIWVSGTLGDAALGLRILRGLAASEDEALELVDRYRTPRPRLALGQALRGIATAALDVSDGLLADLGHILEESRVGAELRAATLPISPTARNLPGALDAALSGGDDYELLFTAPVAARAAVEAAAGAAAVQVTRIGHIEAGKGLRLIGPEGRPMSPRQAGWRHF
ncbi:MAG TPA: thiamine-phosphate kinase [Geminicoccaceae bacterium]|nr:thiamine-phosphate kinase [Geminicoccus sp.]HMU49370.1 thiamine-phosphate kinase [Geminicoccaceae bacterium]